MALPNIGRRHGQAALDLARGVDLPATVDALHGKTRGARNTGSTGRHFLRDTPGLDVSGPTAPIPVAAVANEELFTIL